MKGPARVELHQLDPTVCGQGWLAGEQCAMGVIGPATPRILFQMVESLLDATDARGDARPRRQTPQHREDLRLRISHQQHVGELGLTDHHLRHRPAIRKFVVAERLFQPVRAVHAADHSGNLDVTRGRTIDESGPHPHRHGVDRPADRVGLEPRFEMKDDSSHVVAAMQFAQQDEQIVTDRARDTAVGQLQHGLGDSPHTRDGPHDDVSVEAVRDDDCARVARQDPRDRVGIGLSGHE
ncbi:Uncharacterised protein [Mycobacteroides abscessus subsp. massiliense]|nr:Uncharacterised protein [Mycobacteroides abscessus subsp. massiliense]